MNFTKEELIAHAVSERIKLKARSSAPITREHSLTVRLLEIALNELRRQSDNTATRKEI